LPASISRSYNHPNALDVSPETFRQRFRSLAYPTGAWPWLVAWVLRHRLEMLATAIILMEDFLAAEALVGPTIRTAPPGSKRPNSERRGPTRTDPQIPPWGSELRPRPDEAPVRQALAPRPVPRGTNRSPPRGVGGGDTAMAWTVGPWALAQVTTQSSLAQVTMMESQDRKRAPAWTEQEVRELAIWGDESVLAELRSSKQNGKILEKVSKAMKDRGHNRDAQQCRVKIKELRQAYHKAREANGRSGAEPQTCRFYTELHAMLGGAATTTPTVCFDSINGESHNREASSGYEDDDDEDNEDSSQQGSGETGFPNSQNMFITLDPEPVTPKLTQGMLPDSEAHKGPLLSVPL
uniref:Myb/SANT-like DNA-binding domain-containing protein n=1 Tax=Chrysemys picta bellii TaxID=8478 RepID=A0A8C3HA00_CHRPI